jgi:hypothetical protein
MPACCIHRANYQSEPHPRGNGWERVTCKVCRKWIGDRQKDTRKVNKFLGAFSPHGN